MAYPLKKRRSSRKSISAVCEPLELRRLLNAPGANYKLTFDDEFTGTSLDTSKWSMYLPWSNGFSGDNRFHAAGTPDANGNYSYLSYMMPDDVNLPGDGTLHLTTEQRNVTSPSGHVFNYTEGMITTASSLTSNYGYYEIRAKLPTGAGNWDAWWMTNGWPPEDDIMEYWPGQPRSHQGLYGMDSTWHDYNKTTSATVPTTTWHTFGMQWGPGFQNFFIDGTNTLSLSGSYVPTSANGQYMLLNSGIQNGQTGGYQTGSSAAAIAANTLQVDYVRVYTYPTTAGPAIVNAGLNLASGYTLTGTAAYNPGANLGLTGDGDLHIYGTGEADQTITGLSPNTTYTFAAYGEIGSGTTTGLVGVKGYNNGTGDTSVPVGVVSTPASWVQAGVSFTTGSTGTTAVVYLKNTGTNNLNFDDLSLTLAPILTPISNASGGPGATTAVTGSASTTGSSGSFWSIVGTSSNQALVPNSGITSNGKTLNIVPTATNSAGGTATISVTATDPFGGTSLATTFVLSVLPEIVVNGDPALANVFRIVRNGANVDVYVNNVPTSYAYSSYSAIGINGQNANNSLIIDYAGGDPVTPYGLQFFGAGGTLNISDVNVSGTNSATISSNGWVQITSDFARYFNLGMLNLNLGSGSPTVASSSTTMSATPIMLTVGAGNSLTLATATALPANTLLSVTGGGTLSLNNQSESIDQLTGSGTVSLGSGTLSVGAQNGSSVFSGNMTGLGGLTKVGTGTFTLGAATHYLGGTIVSGGTLEIAVASAILASSMSVSAGAALTIDSGASLSSVTALNNSGTVNFKNASQTIASLNGGGSVMLNPATLTVSSGGTFSGVITGTGGLTVSSGTLTLSGASNYAGATTVSSGKLRLLGPAPVASYNFSSIAGSTVNNSGVGTNMNATLNGGGGSIGTTGGPLAGTGALTLNGTGSTLDVASPIIDFSGTGTWTVSLWVNTTQSGATLFNKGNGSGWSSGYSTFYLGTTAGNGPGAGGVPDAVRYSGGWVAGSATVNTGTWQMVTFISNAGNKSIYTNGSLVNTISLAQGGFSTADVGTTVRFGFAADPTDGPVNLNGSLSDINFYSQALTAAQIQSLYTSNLAGSNVVNVLPSGSQVSLTSSAASLDIEAVNQTLGGLTGVSGSSLILGNGSNLTLANTASTTFAGTISGTGNVTISGGTQVFSGSNTYTGATNVTSGQLTLGNNGALGSTSGLTVSAGATLGLQGNITIPASKTFTINGSGVGGAGALLNVSGTNSWTSSLNLNGSGATIGASSGQLTLLAGLTGGSLTKVGTGALILNGSNTFGSTIAVSAGTLELATGSLNSGTIGVTSSATLNIDSKTTIPSSANLTSNGTTNFGSNGYTAGPATLTLASLSIGAGGLVSIGSASLHDNRTVLICGSLAFAGSTGLLDLADNDLILKNGTPLILSTTVNELTQAFNAGVGYWNGNGGITSTKAATDTTYLTTLGVALNNDGSDNAVFGPGSFDGLSPSLNDILIKYTYYGDADLNGTLNGSDYQQIDLGFGAQGSQAGWAYGDFNNDGSINGSDFSLIDNAMNQLAAAGITAPIALVAGPLVFSNARQISSTDSSDLDQNRKDHPTAGKRVIDQISDLVI